ncbi:MAG: hypothetical protein HeimC2_10560 [Candidatus Heimdallarchaeota archaeon LC_2]|nr:MAG: hypothetical protein HeimC2_10560 [Candidatus Heimdallarchaeota archaeon LC_2]
MNSKNYDSIKWITILLQIVMIASMLNSQVLIGSAKVSTKFDSPISNSIIPQQVGGPVIGSPIVTPSNPSPSDTPTVDVLIDDQDGIDEARLFWEYNSIV